jgi:hypothetical protein
MKFLKKIKPTKRRFLNRRFLPNFGPALTWAGHGLVVFTVFVSDSDPSWSMFIHEVTKTGIIWALVGLVFSHGHSFFSNFLGNGEYKRATSGTLMAGPYARLGILHIIVFIGAHRIESTGAPPTALLILVLSKTVIDLCSHAVAHARAHPEKRHAQLMKFLVNSAPGQGLHTFRTETWISCAVEIFTDDRLMQKFAQQLSALIVQDCERPPEIRMYALSPILSTSDGASPGLQPSRTAIVSRRICLLEMLAMKPPENQELRDYIGEQLLRFARPPLVFPEGKSVYTFMQNWSDYDFALKRVSDPAAEEAAFQEALARYLLRTNLVSVSG